MGQTIKVLGTTVLDGVAIVDTDRSITGQDGSSYASAAETSDDFPGQLAARLFEGIEGVNHVFIASNQVVVGRHGGWDDGTLSAASEVVTEFFVFYDEETADPVS
ncbi:MAG: hypothetical protein WD652_06460 [Acidimicrobiia bacterium]